MRSRDRRFRDGGPDAGSGSGAVPDWGPDAGLSSDDAGIEDAGEVDGDIDAGPADGGDAGLPDAGTEDDAGSCLIDGDLVPAGEWLGLPYQSCVFCDPNANLHGWTVLPVGAPCDLLSPKAGGGEVFSVGACVPTEVPAYPFPECSCVQSGGPCGYPGEPVCCDGICTSDQLCEATRDLGWDVGCNQDGLNLCASGPCCPDARSVDGGSWCCGLTGADSTCLGAGIICHADRDCCSPMTCRHADGAYGNCQ